MNSGKLLKLKLFTLCDYANLSQDGKLSVMGIFDQIFINDTPSQHPRMFVVAVLEGLPNEHKHLKLIISDPLGQENIKQELKVTLGPNGMANLLAELGNLPLPTTGEYTIKLMDSVTLGKIKFSVFKAKSTEI
jgi:hypothetical protein